MFIRAKKSNQEKIFGQKDRSKRGNIGNMIQVKSYSGSFLVLSLSFLLLFFFSVPQANAYFFSIHHNCQEAPCIEGSDMNWTIVMFNEGKQDIEYTSIKIIDSLNGTILAEEKRRFDPLNSDRGNPIMVKVLMPINITIPSKVPAPHAEGMLQYYPCFTNIVSDTYILSKYGEYETEHCYNENESLRSVGCIYDGHCDEGSICSYGKCKKLSCDACQYIQNRTCKSYQCCLDDGCGDDSVCVQNTCVKVSCTQTQYVYNRSCIDVECAFDEIVVNQTCVKIECEEGFYVSQNKSCEPLDCKQEEKIVGNSCRPLECTQEQYPSNHTCKPLECRFDEGYLDHRCVTLSCPLYAYPKDHSCQRDGALILKFLAELFALLLIGLFIFLDLRKYWHRNDLPTKKSKEGPKASKTDKKEKTKQDLTEELKTTEKKEVAESSKEKKE